MGAANRKAKVWCRFGISASDVLLYHNLLLQIDVQDGERMSLIRGIQGTGTGPNSSRCL